MNALYTLGFLVFLGCPVLLLGLASSCAAQQGGEYEGLEWAYTVRQADKATEAADVAVEMRVGDYAYSLYLIEGDELHGYPLAADEGALALPEFFTMADEAVGYRLYSSRYGNPGPAGPCRAGQDYSDYFYRADPTGKHLLLLAVHRSTCMHPAGFASDVATLPWSMEHATEVFDLEWAEFGKSLTVSYYTPPAPGHVGGSFAARVLFEEGGQVLVAQELLEMETHDDEN